MDSENILNFFSELKSPQPLKQNRPANLVFNFQRIHPVGFFELFFISGRTYEHYFGEVAVGFVFKAGDFFSGAD